MKHLMLVLFASAGALFMLNSCDTLDMNEPGLLVPLTADQNPSVPSIAVNGTVLHSEAVGNPSDPMIVVLHGGPGGDYRAMLNCAQFAADSFYVVFYDQRGSGLSQRHSRETYTVQIFIDDLAAVIQHYRRQPDQKVILMGLSWGAMLATAYVNERPAEISGVVMMEPGGLTWNDTEEYVKRSRDLNAFQEISSDYLYLDQILTGDDHNKLDYKAALQSAATWASGNKTGIAGPSPFWRIGAICNAAANQYAKDHSFDFTTNLSQFTTKVLFAYSELNEAYGMSYAQHVSSAYPNVQLEEIKGTGHEIPYFGWGGFYPVAKSYLKTIR